MKELAKQMRPHTVKTTVTTVFLSSILEVTKPDYKYDDQVLKEEEEFEPMAPSIDNFA